MKAKQKVKKKIVKDKVFGCDLVEHLQLSGQEVPQVLKSCTEFVEEHGIVDGIYRLCGISSNVQKLRQEFDLERLPDLNKSPYLQDVHCVSSLCKAYFRELPNPLLTYQLYDKFADAVAIQLEEQRLIKIRDVLKELPLPHFRTLEYLMKHLIHVASFSVQTNMHTRNLAIVWAPNLLRSKDIESSGFNGTAAFMEVRVQSIVVEFILTHVEQLFGFVSADGNLNSTSATMNCVPEDYYRSLSYNLPSMLNHGDGPPQIRPYHTIIEFSDHKRKGSLKAKKWKSIFNLGRSNNDSKRKTTKQDEKDEKSDKMNLRPAKSMDSLSSVPYTADANDLEQRGLTRRSAKHQVPLRRESFGAESKNDEAGYEFSGAGEQAQLGEANFGDYEEEGQAKSEPTTPKSGRASMVTTPQGRSPKNNRNRAEKCVGVHISGPFSVTLPFHITSNLSRLTRGMECPSLSYSSLHRSSERLFSLEGNLYMGSSDTDKVRLTMMSHIDKENSEPKESTIKEESEQKTETHRISLEVQDTFSFLDSQDTSLDETRSVCKAAEEKPIERTEEYSAEEKPTERTEEYSAEENPTEPIVEYSADSEMLQYDLQHNIQMEEFSVEPPQDDPCTEDESDQMYFTPAGCLDNEDPLRTWHDSLEDVYLSAYDDLSPLSEKSNDLYELEEKKNKRPKEKERMEEKTSHGPPDTTTDGQEEALCDFQKPISQPDMVDGSNNTQRGKENQCSPQCNEIDGTTSEVISSIEEPGYCTERDDITCVHEDNPGKETEESSNSGDVTPGPNLEDKDSVEEKGQEEISVLLKLQDGAIGKKDDMLELEAMLLDLCSPDLLLPEYYSKDIPPVVEFKDKDLDCPEQQELDLYNQEVLLMNQPTVINLDLADVRDPQYHDGDVPLIQDPQYHDSDVPLVQDPQYHDSDVPLVQDPQYHGGNVPLAHQLTLKNLDSPKHHDKDDILLEKDMESHSETVRLGLECDEDLNIVEDNMTPKTTENKEEPPCCPSDTPVHDNPQPTADNTINMTENICLPEIVSPDTAEDQHQENEASSWEEDRSTIGNQLQDSESSLCDLDSPHEMIQKDGLSDTVTMTLQIDNPGSGTPHYRSSEPQLLNSQISSFKEQQPSNSTKSPARSESSGASSMNPDGSVTMKLAFSPNKVQHVKSVPVVPPKPQFAKLPPALKSKLHASSFISTTRDTPKSDKAVGLEPAESGIDCTPKRRASWRNATSVSFDTAMALAKDRQQSQNPVRRMQTYCIGDSFDVMDSKMENSPNFPKFTIKAASSRTHRPLSCMSSAEAEYRGNNFIQEDLNTLSIHGAQSQFQQEVYTKEFPQRNRLSMPRIGQQSTDDVHIHAACHQRRSLL